ncbi:MAG TPA: response regulator [Candidatus Bipolaricaulota bacterium]|nr:response regulator [Candidatus Bipolaricaulota bacterium]
MGDPKIKWVQRVVAGAIPASILVADDDQFLVDMMGTIFSRAFPEAELLKAADGCEAVTLYREHCPDIVLLDVMMPAMNGWEACKNIRLEEKKDGQTPVIIIMTGIGPDINALTSPLFEPDAYIDKPLRPARLIDLIISLFSKKRKTTKKAV